MQENVSIIIAAWNAQSTIKRAIESALVQDKVAQVIVVDDASTDSTIKRAQECDDGSGRLQIIKQEKNAGPAAARNKALDNCKGEWITILDADDFFLPGRISGLLEHASDADMIADDMYQVSEDNPDGPRKKLLGDTENLPRLITLEEFVLSNVTRKGFDRKELGFIKPLIRKSFLDNYEIRYRENMRLGEDYELYTRILAHGGRLKLTKAQGYVSVVRPNSLSGSHTPEDLRQLRDCDQILLRDFPALTGIQKAALDRHARDTDCRLQWRLLIEAVKDKNPLAMLRTVVRPWPVPLFLAKNLWEQFYLRVICGKRS